MRQALDQYHVRGLSHNLGFLSQLCGNEEIRAGDMSTNFIADNYPEGMTEELLAPKNPKLFSAIAALIYLRELEENANLSDRLIAAKPFQSGEFTAFLGEKDKQEFEIAITKREDSILVTVDGEEFTIVSDWRPIQPIVNAVVNDQTVTMQLDTCEGGSILSHDGGRIRVQLIERRLAHLLRLMPYKQPPDLSKFLLSPMPGLLVRLAVKEGDHVKAGAELAVVEAMKMENILRAEQDVVIKSTFAEDGENLAVDQKIVEFE